MLLLIGPVHMRKFGRYLLGSRTYHFLSYPFCSASLLKGYYVFLRHV